MVFIDHVNRRTRGLAASSAIVGRLLKREESLEKKLMRPGWEESPEAPLVPEYSSAVLFRALV